MTKQNDLLLSANASPASQAPSNASLRSPSTVVAAAGTASAATSPAPNTAVAGAVAASDHLIYNTQTLCARCSFVDRKGFALKPAQLWERRSGVTGHIVLAGYCETHGLFQTLVCKSADFYQRMLSFTSDHHKFLTLKREPKSKPVRVGSTSGSSVGAAVGAAVSAGSGSATAVVVKAGPKPQLPDIEDLDATLKLNPQSKTLPMV